MSTISLSAVHDPYAMEHVSHLRKAIAQALS